MLLLIISIIVFCLFVIALLINPRKKIINGLHQIVLNQIFLILYIAVVAAFYTLAGINVNLRTILLACLIIPVMVGMRVIKLRKIAQIEWDLYEVGMAFVCVSVVLIIAWRRFGFNLQLTYIDIDAANYFQMAMDLLHTQKVSGEYLSTLIHALFIQMVSGTIQEVSYYKGMIMAHIYMQTLSIGMFYVLLSKLNRERHWKWINAIISVLYFGGYQLYILVYGSFFHWEDGILIIMLIINIIIDMQKEQNINILNILFWILGCFGLVVCYPFFSIMLAWLLIPEVIVWIKTHIPHLNYLEKCIGIFSGLVALCTGIFFALQRIDSSLEVLLYNLNSDGLAYKEPYQDFIFFLPLFISYVIIMCSTKQTRECKVVFRMNIFAVIYMIFWFGLYINDKISSYYYYRNYYIVWLLSWLMVDHVINFFIQKKQTMMLIGYSALYGIAIITSVLSVNSRLWNMKSEMYLQKNADYVLCPLYAFNANAVQGEHQQVISDSLFDLYDFCITNFRDEQVNMVSSVYSAMQSAWFLAITDTDVANNVYSLDNHSLRQILLGLDSGQHEYILIPKSDPVVMEYYDLIFMKANVVKENPDGTILKRSTATWSELLYKVEGSSAALEELCIYARENYRLGQVKLVCEADLTDEITFYRMFVGEDSTSYIGDVDTESFVPKTYIFNNDEVEYMAVLKASKIYQQNKEYFDLQNILFENDAGMVITHAGSGWMPSEQA